MATRAIFAAAPARAGMYESFYLRAVAPDRALGTWIRHTVHKAPGQPPRGSVWCTVFDGSRGAPFMHKITSDDVRVPRGGWIAVGDLAREGASISATRAGGACGGAAWTLDIAADEPELRHLPADWLYRAPLPRTKLTSPLPAARFSGTLDVPGRETLELQGWRGMVGHNWGSEHAERWIWLHGIDFAEQRDAWLDVALGRVLLAGRMTPWIANGALSLGTSRIRVGGLRTRVRGVRESPAGCDVQLRGEGGVELEVTASVPHGTAAGWRYADPHGSGAHDVVNCSIASISVSLAARAGAHARTLHSANGGAYELGMRERDHGVALAPFDDG
jgi:hypothetical protein